MRDVEQQIDLLFSRVETEKNEREADFQKLRRLIPITDLKDRAHLQKELNKAAGIIDMLTKWVRDLESRVAFLEEQLREAELQERLRDRSTT